MSKICNFVNFCLHRTCALFLMLSFGTVCSLPASVGSTTIQSEGVSNNSSGTFDPMWILEGIESFDENITAEEMVRFVAKVKIEVERFTGEAFPIENWLYLCKESMQESGVDMDWDHFDDFVAHVQEAELLLIQEENNDDWKPGALHQQSCAITNKGKHTRRPDPFLDNASKGQVIAALECFCGSLLCIIPLPLSRWAGGILVVDGLKKLSDPVIEQLDNPKKFFTRMNLTGKSLPLHPVFKKK